MPRSIDGIAVSGDGTSLYLGLIQGSTSSHVYKIPSTPLRGVRGNCYTKPLPDPGGVCYDDSVTRVVLAGPQPKVISSDDRGYAWVCLSGVKFQVYDSSMTLIQEITSMGTTSITGITVVKQAPSVYNAFVTAGSSVYAYDVSDFGDIKAVNYFYSPELLVPTYTSSFSFSTTGKQTAVDDDGNVFVAAGTYVVKRTPDGTQTQTNTAGGATVLSGANGIAVYAGLVAVTHNKNTSPKTFSVILLRADDLTFVSELLVDTSVVPAWSYASAAGFRQLAVNSDGLLFISDSSWKLSASSSSYTPYVGALPITGNNILFDRVLSVQL
jgi:hypothetical protein